MDVILEKIAAECNEAGIQIKESKPGVYTIEGLYEGSAYLYICETDEAVVFENALGEKLHVLSFRDFVNTAMFWCKSNKNWPYLNVKESAWYKVFKSFSTGRSYYELEEKETEGKISFILQEDLPF